MGAYESFATVYDQFMGDTDYEKWIEYLELLWKKYSFTPKLIVDLGCGTGNVTLPLSNKGYELIGIDFSLEMLSQAKQKAEQQGKEILYLCQDMREFELYGTVDCIISLYDSLNYITKEEELLSVFSLVNNYLEPRGLFIFDMNTEFKFKNVLGDKTFAETAENAAYIWENYFDEEEGINEFYMNFFIQQKETGTYSRFEEFHYEKAYSTDLVRKLIEKSGMEFLDMYDAYSFDAPKSDSERVFFVAREKGK